MKTRNGLTKILALLGLAAFAAPASADLMYTLNVEVGNNDEGTSATVTFANFTNTGGLGISFDVIVNNTTPSSISGALTSLAWAMQSGISGLQLNSQTSADAINFSLVYDENSISFSPVDALDACLLTNDNNCLGGNVADGLANGYSATFNITATMLSETTAAAFEAALQAAIETDISSTSHPTVWGLCARFQGLPEAAGTNQEGSDKKCTYDEVEMPEPGSLALIGLGLGLFGLARRRVAKVA